MLGALFAVAAAAEPPRVFRAVLDGRPRAVVVDLGSGFWLSWDAERCAPTKVWHGAVRLVGAVYDTQHGPTPRSAGQTLWLSREPVAWRLDGAEAAPRFDGDEKTENARITVRHNGVVIHEEQELPGPTGGGEAETPEPKALLLQDHGNAVVYRNIWLVPS